MLKASRQTSSSPSTSKSSPDDISSDVFQETAIMDMQARKQPAGGKRWLTGKSDNMTPNCLVPIESCTSDLDDHSAEEAATEVYPHPAGDSVFEDSTCEQIDCKVFSPFQSQIKSDLGFYMDSLFSNDFGKAHNGILFQDGTYEQDVSLDDILEVLQNHDEDSYKGSVSLKTSTLGSVTEMSGHIPVLPHGMPGNMEAILVEQESRLGPTRHKTNRILESWWLRVLLQEEFVCIVSGEVNW